MSDQESAESGNVQAGNNENPPDAETNSEKPSSSPESDRPSIDSDTTGELGKGTPEKAPSSPPPSAALSKIEVIFKAVGDAPILKQSKWNVPSSKTIGWVNGNIRKYLKLETSESLFLYVRQSFAPSLDQTIENLYDCFGSGNGKLIMHYSKTQAWG